jgi:hypothetical protein
VETFDRQVDKYATAHPELNRSQCIDAVVRTEKGQRALSHDKHKNLRANS